jgi:hypothetical protein
MRLALEDLSPRPASLALPLEATCLLGDGPLIGGCLIGGLRELLESSHFVPVLLSRRGGQTKAVEALPGNPRCHTMKLRSRGLARVLVGPDPAPPTDRGGLLPVAHPEQDGS